MCLFCYNVLTGFQLAGQWLCVKCTMKTEQNRYLHYFLNDHKIPFIKILANFFVGFKPRQEFDRNIDTFPTETQKSVKQKI